MISFTLWDVLKYTYNIQTVVVGFFFFTFITIYIYKLMLLVEGLHGWFFFSSSNYSYLSETYSW